MPQNGAVRNLVAFILSGVVCAIVGFAAFYGFVHRPIDEGRVVQVVYSAVLLLPPALFLVLAVALLLRDATGASVLGLVGIAIFVGAPTLVYFLGGLFGVLLTAFALVLIGTTSAAMIRRGEPT
jgi:hypothetical protein